MELNSIKLKIVAVKELHPKTPVILVSGQGVEAKKIEEWMVLGLAGFVPKPFSHPKDFKDLLWHHIEPVAAA